MIDDDFEICDRTDNDNDSLIDGFGTDHSHGPMTIRHLTALVEYTEQNMTQYFIEIRLPVLNRLSHGVK